MKNINAIIAATTKTPTDAREGTLEAKARLAAEKAVATEQAATEQAAATKASKAQSLADRNHNAQAAKAERKAVKKAAVRKAIADRKAANKAAEAERAAARATAEKTAAAKPIIVDDAVTPEVINELGARMVEYNDRMRTLTFMAKSTDDDAEYAITMGTLRQVAAERRLLRMMLTAIEKQYRTDAAMLTLIHAAKAGKSYEHEDEVEKTTGVNLMRYRAVVIKPENIFDQNVLRAINALHMLDAHGRRKTMKNGESASEYYNRIKAEACRALAYLEDIFDQKIAFPTLCAEQLETRTMAQSLTSEIVGIHSPDLQDKLVILDHNLWARFNVMDANDLFPCRYYAVKGEELTGAQRIERIVKGYIARFEEEGFNVTFGKQKAHFESWCYSNSGLKKGVGMLMNTEAMHAHYSALHLGLEELPDTNGQEQYKIAALFNTPSKLWERKWKDAEGKEHKQRIHLRDVIMMKSIKIKIPLPEGSIFVGKGEDVTITVRALLGNRTVTLPITVNEDNTMTVTIEGWDGLALVNIKDFDPCQCRWAGSMKMLCIGVYGLLDKIIAAKPEYAAYAGNDIYVEDIDGNMQLWREGCVLTTDTTWKAKKWFRGQNGEANWSMYVEHCEKIAQTYDGFDCLRVVSNADAIDEMDDNRHTSRQLLSQLINMTEDDAHLLIENNATRAAKLSTVEGALHRLAGLGKAKEEVNQTEYLFRAKPWLVGQSKVKTAMLVKMYDELATMASCSFATRESSLYTVQDIAAMMEIALLGANPDKPGLGMLNAGECNVMSMRDGQKFVLVRYPSNGLNASVMKNHKLDMFDVCGNVIMLNIHDPWIIKNDGDCDGDHGAAYKNNWLICMFERLEVVTRKLGLNKTVIFEHGDGAQSKKATKEWMAHGRVEAVFNGMAFNYVGRFSNASLFAWTMCSKAYHAGNYEEAYKWGMLANLFQVAAILTIDWCKTGVPAEGTPSRRIFEVALDLLDLMGDFENGHAYAYKPWAQLFRDHEPGCCFVTKSKPVVKMSAKGNKYLKHNYAKPSAAAIDTIAAAVMDDAGLAYDETGVITKARFEATPGFDIVKELCIEPNVIEINRQRVFAKNAQNGIVLSKLLHRISPNRFNPDTLDGAEDREIATAIANNKPVSVLKFTQFCFRLLAELERGFANEAKNNATEFSSADVHRVVYKATRSMLYSMLDDTPWSYKPRTIDPATGDPTGPQLMLNDIVDRDRKWQIVVDTVMRDAFEISGENRFGKNDDNKENAARVKARYAMFVLNVFAPDLLDRVERKEHVSNRKANLEFVTVDEINGTLDKVIDEGQLLIDEEAYECLYDE